MLPTSDSGQGLISLPSKLYAELLLSLIIPPPSPVEFSPCTENFRTASVMSLVVQLCEVGSLNLGYVFKSEGLPAAEEQVVDMCRPVAYDPRMQRALSPALRVNPPRDGGAMEACRRRVASRSEPVATCPLGVCPKRHETSRAEGYASSYRQLSKALNTSLRMQLGMRGILGCTREEDFDLHPIGMLLTASACPRCGWSLPALMRFSIAQQLLDPIRGGNNKNLIHGVVWFTIGCGDSSKSPATSAWELFGTAVPILETAVRRREDAESCCRHEAPWMQLLTAGGTSDLPFSAAVPSPRTTVGDRSLQPRLLRRWGWAIDEFVHGVGHGIFFAHLQQLTNSSAPEHGGHRRALTVRSKLVIVRRVQVKSGRVCSCDLAGRVLQVQIHANSKSTGIGLASSLRETNWFHLIGQTCAESSGSMRGWCLAMRVLDFEHVP